jgi:sulfur carrier protein
MAESPGIAGQPLEPDPGSSGVGKASSIKQPFRPYPPDTAFCVLRSGNVTITLNGEKKEVPDNITVLALLDFMKVQHQRVAVELNMEIVKKSVYAATTVKEGDSVEVVSFMQGGG